MSYLNNISTLTIFLAIGLSCCAGNSLPSTTTSTEIEQSPSTNSPLTIINPEIPVSIKFADQVIDLDRIDMYERLDRELTSILYTHGNTLLLIKRANKLFPIIAPILKDNGIPSDLIYLACIESTLNPRAYSSAKAAGIWQFMPATAKQYGLEVNDWVDERYNIEKETEAACKYLKKAYAEYGNWESAAAAYNGYPIALQAN